LTFRDSSKNVSVSVIVPTYNSARNLPACLEALRKQKYPNIEVLVIDNYSNDETRQICETFKTKIILHRGTPAAARNAGIAHSTGNFVLFVDSDQQLGDSVIENCVSLCTTQDVDAVKIPEVFVGVNFWGKCSALWKNSMVKAWGPKGGIPRFYRKEKLLKQLVFNGDLRWWEDMELYQRLKSTGLRDAWCSRKLIHNETDSPTLAVRKYACYGKSVTAFRRGEAEAPYTATINLSFSTLAQIPRNSGRSISVLLGCLFLVTVKTFSAALGFLSGLR
jgi:glycosyltransferase involved in cell wall biosynthesis